jgi:hypothetical protein
LKTVDGKNISSTGFEFYIRENSISMIPVSPDSEPELTSFPDYHYSRNQSVDHSGRDNNLPPDYPAPTYVYTGSGVSDGYIFFTPTVRLTAQYEKYLTIWDNYGTPIFYKKVNKTVTDFKVLDEGILTYAVNGLQNPALDCYYLMDINYDIYDSVRAGKWILTRMFISSGGAGIITRSRMPHGTLTSPATGSIMCMPMQSKLILMGTSWFRSGISMRSPK